MSEKLTCPYCGELGRLRLHDDRIDCETWWCDNGACDLVWWYERGKKIGRIRNLERQLAEASLDRNFASEVMRIYKFDPSKPRLRQLLDMVDSLRSRLAALEWIKGVPDDDLPYLILDHAYGVFLAEWDKHQKMWCSIPDVDNQWLWGRHDVVGYVDPRKIWPPAPTGDGAMKTPTERASDAYENGSLEVSTDHLHCRLIYLGINGPWTIYYPSAGVESNKHTAAMGWVAKTAAPPQPETEP